MCGSVIVLLVAHSMKWPTNYGHPLDFCYFALGHENE